jgi:hypothetical protein
MSMWDELKERNILKLILIVRFACATLDVGHPIRLAYGPFCQVDERTDDSEASVLVVH